MIQREIIIRAPPTCLQTMVMKEDKEIGREAIIQNTIIIRIDISRIFCF